MTVWNAPAITFRRGASLIGRAQQALFRGEARRAARWRAAAAREPALAGDLIVLGRLLALSPQDGMERLAASPEQLAYEAGRRDMALEMLAMMHVTPDQVRDLMDRSDDHEA